MASGGDDWDWDEAGDEPGVETEGAASAGWGAVEEKEELSDEGDFFAEEAQRQKEAEERKKMKEAGKKEDNTAEKKEDNTAEKKEDKTAEEKAQSLDLFAVTDDAAREDVPPAEPEEIARKVEEHARLRELRKKQEEDEVDIVMDTFGVSSPVDTRNVDPGPEPVPSVEEKKDAEKIEPIAPAAPKTLDPKTLDDFKKFATTIVQSVAPFKDSPHYGHFLETLLNGLGAEMTLKQANQCNTTMSRIVSTKQRAEMVARNAAKQAEAQAARAKVGKGKQPLVPPGPGAPKQRAKLGYVEKSSEYVDQDTYDDYDDDAMYDDYM